MRQADVTRQRLIRTALELFTAQGYHATTTGQIAKKAGIAEGTMYRHFASKQHLLNELYRGAARWATKVVQAADAERGAPREKLAGVAAGLVEGATRDPAVVKLFLLDRHASLLDEDSHRAAREFRAGLERIVAQGKAEGSVRIGGADVWAGVWLAVVSHVVEKVAGREWGANHPAMAQALQAAWHAISAATPDEPVDSRHGGP